MSQVNDPVDLLQQTRANFIIETDVTNIREIKSNLRKLTSIMASNQTKHDSTVKQLQSELTKEQAKAKALSHSLQEQSKQVKRVEEGLNLPKLIQETESLVQEINELQRTIQSGLKKVVETQHLLTNLPEKMEDIAIPTEDQINILKLRLYHSMDLTVYQDQLLDLRNEARPLSAENIWDKL